MTRGTGLRQTINLVLVVLLVGILVPASAAATVPPPPPKGAALVEETAQQPQSPAAAEALRRIEPALLKQILEAGDGTVPFIVYLKEEADLASATAGRVSDAERQEAVVTVLQATANRSQAQVRAYLEGQRAVGKVRKYTPYWVFNGLAVEGDRETLFALAARPEVRVIRADHVRYLHDSQADWSSEASGTVEWNVARIRADSVWDALGIDGAGVVVASMDTGVDWQHPALLTKYRGYDPHGLYKHIGNWYCATNEGYVYPGDGHGHGTHTMGTMVGGGEPAIGVAPGARWIAVKAFNDQGSSLDSWLHAGFQWLLDPDGDPGTDDAPDVVNNSWGSSDGYLEVFRPDVQALRAAGIFPVFSAGNDGPAMQTINSPASYPESFAVGATDRDDYVAVFSSRGPSPWGEVKPEVSAPGVNVRSSLPGGSYGVKSGTSMAAPHVAGLVALLLQADPSLTVSELEEVIASTAVPLGDPVPNNSYGWGRIDAYNAVTTVSDSGLLAGTVTDSSNGQPIVGALLSATPRGEDSSVHTMTDSQGHYSVALASYTYDVTASAFAYETSTAYSVVITTGTTTVQDFALAPSPVGALVGRVTEAGTGAYLPATVIAVGTPAVAQTDPGTGLYSLALPAGTYDIRVESPGHRVGWAYDVPISVGGTTTGDFALISAPTILLVDSGAWYGESEIVYFEQALDDLRYLYDLWAIHQPFDTPSDVPAADDLLPYDLVVWSCPEDSPGYVGAWDGLAGYLDAGGKLFISGQDVGYWDDGGYPFGWVPQYEEYLKASFVADDAGTRSLGGLPGGIFEGLALSVEGGDGADNQLHPDEIGVADPDPAASVVEYEGDGSGGQQVGLCLPYRLVYLSFGFEAISQGTDRDQVMERVVDWLVAPREAAGVELSPPSQIEIGVPGATVSHTVRVRNTGEAGTVATYELTIAGEVWPTTVTSDTVQLAPCDVANVNVLVDIPVDESWQAYDTAVLTARSVLSPMIVATATVTTKTPAPVLLVDDDRWYDEESHYQNALEGNGYAYDYWEVNEDWPWESPPLEILQRYPVVVWFTGYDWYQPLTAAEEDKLATYLDGGGRLFFSGQDYLYSRGVSSFARDYLGVLTYTEDMTTTLALGEPGSLVGDSLGPYGLSYPFRNYSDVVTPTVASEVAFRGQRGLAAGLAHAGVAYRTVFFSFPFEVLDSGAALRVMQRVIGWLSWLGESTVAADRSVVEGGGTLTYTLSLQHDGWTPVSGHLSNTLPLETAYLDETLSPPEASYDPGARRVSWDGELSSDETVLVTYQVTVSDTLPPGTTITNLADIGYDEHNVTFDRWARTRVNVADLSTSTLEADKAVARLGDPLLYTIIVRNVGFAPASSARLVNAIPEGTTYISGSLSIAGGGIGLAANGVMTWTGTVNVGAPVTITYAATVTEPSAGLTITNRADLYDDYGTKLELTAATLVPLYKYYFPIALREYGPKERRWH